MTDSQTRPRRSLVVVLLDAVLRLVAAFHTGGTPTPKVRAAGGRRGVGRYLLVIGVLAALAGTALLVVVLVRAPAGSPPPPGRAGSLPGLQSQPAEPSAALSALPGLPDPTATPSTSKATPATTRPVTSPTGRTPVTEIAQVPLTASYKTSSVTAGLLGYRMTVTVANPGEAPKDGWALTVTLPRSTLRITGVNGATAAQDGSEWSFTPDTTTSRVPASGSVELTFDVQGATLINAAPEDCRIDGNPCTP